MISASHVNTAHLHYDDLMAEVARERIAAQARLATTPASAGVPPRPLPRGGVRAAAHRALAGVATVAGAVVLAHR
jgi:hypothetical protein